jgi:phage terminase large subunit-like protein
MREQLRPNAFARMCQNQWVNTDASFVSMELYDACIDPQARPVLADRSLSVVIGVDASVKGDQTAISVAAYDRDSKCVRHIWHRTFQPSKDNPLDFEGTIERTLVDLNARFHVLRIFYDPYQMVAVAQRLQRFGLPMREFPQTTGNLTEASQNLFDLIKGRNLVLYPDPDIRLAISRAVAIEGARGWRIAKEKASHKIDIVVALAQAALGAILEPRHKFTCRPLYY